jgi:hypothetical protein
MFQDSWEQPAQIMGTKEHRPIAESLSGSKPAGEIIEEEDKTSAFKDWRRTDIQSVTLE